MADNPFAALGSMLQAIGTCPKCGKSRLVMATGWKGHGTGRHGEAYYNATSYETITLETHCSCPGGPAHHLLPKEADNG